MSFENILRKLENGELPEELDFRPKQAEEIDWDKVKYNTFYRSDEYILQRFPNSMAFQNLPSSEKLLDAIKTQITTPLQEMEERQNIIVENIIEYDDEKEEEPKTDTISP